AKQFEFEPAEIDNKPSPVKITYRYDFTVKVEKVSLGPQVNFDGVVLDRFKKKPIKGAVVKLLGLDAKVTTAEDGTFAFLDVPAGAGSGRGLGGLVGVDLMPLSGDCVNGYLASDVIDTSAMLSVKLAPRLRLAVAGRYSSLDKVLKGVSSEDVGEFVPIPRYHDYQARASLDLRKDEELVATFLASDDHLQRTIPSKDPTERRVQNTDSSYKRFILRYTRLMP